MEKRHRETARRTGRSFLATRTPPYPLVGATAPLVPRYANASVSNYAYASGDGQEQTRFRSPYAPSIRPTGGKYLCAGETPAGNTASARE